jgi:hypothetical protein
MDANPIQPGRRIQGTEGAKERCGHQQSKNEKNASK